MSSIEVLEQRTPELRKEDPGPAIAAGFFIHRMYRPAEIDLLRLLSPKALKVTVLANPT